MRILIATNIYPPQELGGYGRSMADFAWGLLNRGHQVVVLTSDAPYLQASASLEKTRGPSGERVDRRLQLKGSYQDGVSLIQDPVQSSVIDRFNHVVVKDVLQEPWDGVLLGNIDLLGPEFLVMLLQAQVPLLHHIGFMDPPFPKQCWPQASHYMLVAASQAVRSSLLRHGLPVAQVPVVYPGVRSDLFGDSLLPFSPALRFSKTLCSAGFMLGSAANPLKVGYAGLLMGTKGVHTLIEALVLLFRQGIAIQVCLAGAEFQPGYRRQLQNYLCQADMHGFVQFVGQLNRPALSRFWELQHLGVFSSIYPEAFGIVAAEVMASGAALVTSGVGGAAELLSSHSSGRRFRPGQAGELAAVLHQFVDNPQSLFDCAYQGQELVRSRFDVMESVRQLETLFLNG